MDTKEVAKRMKDFGLKGVRDGSAHLFIKPDLLAEFVQSEILAEREACAKALERVGADVAGEYLIGKDAADLCAAIIRARSNAGIHRAAEGRPVE